MESCLVWRLSKETPTFTAFAVGQQLVPWGTQTLETSNSVPTLMLTRFPQEALIHICPENIMNILNPFFFFFYYVNIPTHVPSLLVYPTGQLCLVIRETPLERDRIGRPMDDTSCGRSLALTLVPLVKACPLSSPAQDRPSPSSTVPGGQRHLKLPGTLRHWWAQGLGVCRHSLISEKQNSIQFYFSLMGDIS